MRLELVSRYLQGIATSYVNTAPEHRWANRFRLLNNFLLRYPVSASVTPEGDFILVRDLGGRSIFISRQQMIHRFKNGVSHRLSALASEYMLERVGLTPGDIVIDIGANIGEVSKAIAEAYKARSIAIEPDPKEFQCLLRNTTQAQCLALNLALWSESSARTIYYKNSTSDTSLIQPKDFEREGSVSAFRLDDVMEREDVKEFLGGRAIRLIKVEGEGAEPEILKGAEATLARTSFVTVDCGPERGINEEPTLVDVADLLLELRFCIIGYVPSRSIFLFRNRMIRNP